MEVERHHSRAGPPLIGIAVACLSLLTREHLHGSQISAQENDSLKGFFVFANSSPQATSTMSQRHLINPEFQFPELQLINNAADYDDLLNNDFPLPPPLSPLAVLQAVPQHHVGVAQTPRAAPAAAVPNMVPVIEEPLLSRHRVTARRRAAAAPAPARLLTLVAAPEVAAPPGQVGRNANAPIPWEEFATKQVRTSSSSNVMLFPITCSFCW